MTQSLRNESIGTEKQAASRGFGYLIDEAATSIVVPWTGEALLHLRQLRRPVPLQLPQPRHKERHGSAFRCFLVPSRLGNSIYDTGVVISHKRHRPDPNPQSSTRRQTNCAVKPDVQQSYKPTGSKIHQAVAESCSKNGAQQHHKVGCQPHIPT